MALAPSLARLADHLFTIGNQLPFQQALELAIDEWIASHPARPVSPASPAPPAPPEPPAPPAPPAIDSVRGYQWKNLFLPDQTELRMLYKDATAHARVCGDALLYQGQKVTPRQFTIMVAGDGRNAWRDLWVRLPGAGQPRWKRAADLRRALENDNAGRAGAPAASPLAAMSAAAAAMSEALRAALALTDHVNAQSHRTVERRVADHRRVADLEREACMLD